MLTLWASILALLGVIPHSAAQDVPAAGLPVTVCQVLQNLPAYDGKVISIRGPWNGGDLWGDCPAEDWLRPNAIQLNRIGVQDYDSAVATVNRTPKQRGVVPVATIVGRLEIRRPSEYPPSSSIDDPNSFRARLVATAIQNVSVERIVPINQGKPITVCDALQHRAKYDGTFVEIRGRFYGNSLAAQCDPLRTEHFEWPTIIELSLPESRPVPPAAWTVDVAWYDRMVRESGRIGAGSRKPSVPKKDIRLEEPVYGPALFEYLGIVDLSPLATVVGRFDSRENIDLQSAQYPYGRYGYGHLNQLPASLVLVDLRDFAQFQQPKRPGK
jgi:hypothetical protein